MKTIVIGSAGQLGRDLTPLLPGEVVPLTRSDADLSNPSQLQCCLQVHRPDLVINCAAWNFVDRAESEPEAAFAVNSWGVRSLAEICRSLDATLVHFSTDYVFGSDTSRRTPWQISDAPGPVSAYGLSKLEGEYWVRMYCPRHFIIRTCGLYGVWGSGGKGGNFVETMLRLAGQGKPLRVVADQICTPSFTLDVAKATVALIATGHFGLYQITNGGACSWFEFAKEIFRLGNISAELTAITTMEFGAKAARPAYSVLDQAACSTAGVSSPRCWPEALAEYLHIRGKR